MNFWKIASVLTAVLFWGTVALGKPTLVVVGSDASQAMLENSHRLFLLLPEDLHQDPYFPLNLQLQAEGTTLLVDQLERRRDALPLEILLFLPSAWKQEDPAALLQDLLPITLPEKTRVQVSWEGGLVAFDENLPEQIRPRQEPFPSALRSALKEFGSDASKRRLVVVLTDHFPVAEWHDQQIATLLAQNHVSLHAVFFPGVEVSNIEGTSRIHRIGGKEELPAIWEQVLAEADSEWMLTYQDPNWHGDGKTLQIHARTAEQEYEVIWQAPGLHYWPELEVPVWSGGVALAGATLFAGLLWWNRRPRVPVSEGMGFQLLSPREKDQVVPIPDSGGSLEFLTKLRTQRKLRLSANLHRVLLTPQDGSMMLEDKNYKNALLINRRRIHRRLLQHGDLLDVGEMVLMFHNPKQQLPEAEAEETKPSVPVLPAVWIKPNGPLRKGLPSLQFADARNDFPLVRNITFIGSAHTNDVQLISSEIAARHAKIVKIGGQFKLVNLAGDSTLINGRRVEQRFLREGDEIMVGDSSFRFRFGRPSSNKPKPSRREGANRSHENV